MICCRGFKGLKQAIKLEFKLGRYNDVAFSCFVCGGILTGYRLLNITENS